MRAKILKFYGIDYFDRVVFIDEDGRFYKSVNLATGPVDSWNSEKWESYLVNLHDTDDFEGEPGFPVDRRNFQFTIPTFEKE